MIDQLPQLVIDVFMIFLGIGTGCIILGIIGITWCRMTSNNFWARHQKIKAKDAKAKWDKASKAAYDGRTTRKKNAKDVAIILECDL